MSHRMLRPVASAAAVVMLMAACTSSPTATPRPTQTSVQATAAATTQATSAATTAATSEATAEVTAQTQSVPTDEVTAEAQAATAEATEETALVTSEAPVGTTVAMATEDVATVEATEEAAEPTVEAVEPTEEVAVVTAEATEEETTVAVETAEATVEAGTPVAMATVEATEEAAEPTVEATEAVATVEATEEAAEPTVEATQAATAEPTMEVVVVTSEPTAEATVPSGPQTFTDSDLSDGGITFVYPEGFVLTGGDKQAILTAPDGGVINVYAPDTYAQVLGGETFTSDADALAFFVDRVGLGPDEEPAADATAEPAATAEAAATVEAADLITNELARTEAVLARRDQAGTAYLVDVGGGSYAVLIWLTPTGTEPSADLVAGLTSVADTLEYTPPPPPPTEEPVAVEPTVAPTAEATAEAAATTEASADATAEATAMATADTAALPASVVEVAMGNSDFTTLVNAVIAADLVPALSDDTASYTVFAPTNEAFAASLESMGMTADELLSEANRETLTAILQYHVIPSTVLSADLVAGDVETLQGESVTITVDGGKVMVNDANVVTADIESGNGVVHVIDKVLVPPTLQ